MTSKLVAHLVGEGMILTRAKPLEEVGWWYISWNHRFDRC